MEALFILGAIFVAYFLPAVIAKSRGADNTLAIFFLNFILGWTVVVWVAAFIWACVDKKRGS